MALPGSELAQLKEENIQLVRALELKKCEIQILRKINEENETELRNLRAKQVDRANKELGVPGREYSVGLTFCASVDLIKSNERAERYKAAYFKADTKLKELSQENHVLARQDGERVVKNQVIQDELDTLKIKYSKLKLLAENRRAKNQTIQQIYDENESNSIRQNASVFNELNGLRAAFEQLQNGNRLMPNLAKNPYTKQSGSNPKDQQ